MDVLSNLAYGFSVALQPINILYCLIGTVFGVIVGALPGLGPSAGLAIILPLTFGMNPVAGIIMLCGIYYGTMYGGGITSILLGIPGDPASVATTFDGYPMATKRKRPGAALGMSFFASFIGGTICVVIFTFLAPSLAKYALSFGPPEYFALMLLGLTTIAGLTGKNPYKGFISALVGLLFATVGVDLVAGVPRYTFGSIYLLDGIDFVPAAMGLFGIAELICTSKDESYKGFGVTRKDIGWRKMLPSRDDWRHALPFIGTGSIIGFFIGMLPGAGATIASFISYGTAKRLSKRGDEFGTGVPEGIACCESSNNAASVGAMVPLMTLGVPGSGATAIMLGALMMFGLAPGPLLFSQHPDFVWGLIASMYLGNFLIFLLCLTTVVVFVKVLQVPVPKLNAVVMAFILVGAYSMNNSMFDVGMTVAFGLLGYLMKKLEYPPAPFVLSLVLGNLLEKSMRQSMILSDNSPAIFFTRPLSGTIMVICILVVAKPLIETLIGTLRRRLAAGK
jgi:putative tricarboxylic transport membrane protein